MGFEILGIDIIVQFLEWGNSNNKSQTQSQGINNTSNTSGRSSEDFKGYDTGRGYPADHKTGRDTDC